MDPGRYRLRSFEEADLEAEARMWGRLRPDRPTTAEELRRFARMLDRPPMFFRKCVAEDRTSGAAIAVGVLSSPPDAYDPQRFWADVGVDPAHQGRGVGRRLAAEVLGWADGLGAVSVTATAYADSPRAVEFLSRQGFVERRRRWRSRLRLDLAELPDDRTLALAAEGITFRTLSESTEDRAELERRILDLELAVNADVPRVGTYTPEAFRPFLVEELHDPALLPEAFFLAARGDRLIGLCCLQRVPSDPEELHVGFTGVVREERGRGVATELKRRSVVFARSHGFRSITTYNDSLNRPIWRINERQGYRREAEIVVGELEPGGR